jgi:pyruvate/2-oxoglutarate dehydrogenase complex dihydrolipoamide acyltransferase (E2) component
MPQMGVSVAEGTIVEWRKRAGDWVQADEPICDITTDKIDVEVPSPSSGRVERVLVEPGETVSVGTLLAEIDPAAKPGEAHPEEDVTRARTQNAGAPAPGGARPQLRPRRRTASRTDRDSTRRWCGGLPTSTESISPR